MACATTLDISSTTALLGFGIAAFNYIGNHLRTRLISILWIKMRTLLSTLRMSMLSTCSPSYLQWQAYEGRI